MSLLKTYFIYQKSCKSKLTSQILASLQKECATWVDRQDYLQKLDKQSCTIPKSGANDVS